MKYVLTIGFLWIQFTLCAQTWQWGKRGGSSDNLSFSGGYEQVSSVVTDSQKNIYIISSVGSTGLEVDGNSKQSYGDPQSITDTMLASFSCDGTYRWSKVIGGAGKEYISGIQIDADDNIYIAGKFTSCDPVGQYPARIDDDVILDQTNEACQLLFLAKYNSNGALQWFRQPEAAVDVTVTYSQTGFGGLAFDNSGGISLLLLLPPGVYADGAFTATQAGSHYYMFKYNADGLFLQAIPIDIQHAINVDPSLKMYFNGHNGHFYFTGERYGNEEIFIGGSEVMNGFYIASFDENGQFLWKRETVGSWGSFVAYNLEFDSTDNIYMAGKIVGINTVSFLGYSTSILASPPYVMKLNPMADSIIWVSNSNTSTDIFGAMAVNGNEMVLTTYAGGNYVLGNQSININSTNQGTRVLLARFNATSGACEHLDFIPSNNAGVNCGTAIAVDASGDYIIGGGFTGTQNYLTNSTTSIGGQSDFFVTKYATSVCSPLKVDSLDETGLKFYPNPVKSILRLEIDSEMSYVLIDQSGRGILKGSVSSKDAEINVSGVSSGAYILKLTDADGEVNTIRIIKE